MWQRVGRGGARYWGRKGAGIIFTDGKAILLLRRAEGVDSPFAWSIPGGKVEDDETFLGAAQRETREETGHLPNCTRLATFDFTDGRFTFKSFLCRVDKRFECELSDEHTSYKWFPLEEIHNLKLHPGFRQILPSVLRTIREKIKDDVLEESVLNNNIMRDMKFKPWMANKELLEVWYNPFTWFKAKAAPKPDLQYDEKETALGSEINRKILNDLGIPPESRVEYVLQRILRSLAQPPIGKGGYLNPAWFDYLAKKVIESFNEREKKNIPQPMTDPTIEEKIKENEFWGDDVINLIRQNLQDFYHAHGIPIEPGNEYNDKRYMSWTQQHQSASDQKKAAYYRKMFPSAAPTAPTPTTPATPAAPTAPSSGGPGSGPATTPGIPSTFQDALDKMPDSLWNKLFGGKQAAHASKTLQDLAQMMGLSINFSPTEIQALLNKRKGPPPTP